jgi:hypothetical protein
MPFALHSFILEPNPTRKDAAGARILVQHTFYGETEAEAEKFKRHHLGSCEYFRAAEKEHRVIEILEEIDYLPEADEEALKEFLDLDGDEEDDADPEDG